MSTKSKLALIVVAALIPFWAVTAAKIPAPGIQTIAYQEDFEDGQAQGWELESGWQAIQEEGNYVLAGQGHFWARSNQSFEGDQRVSFRLKLLRGRIHLVYRMNESGRYFIGFTADRSDLNKHFWPDEFQNNLASGNASHNPNAWHRVEIVSEGATLKFIVDGAQEWTFADPQPFEYGSFAFETLEDSQAFIDDITVTLDTDPVAAPTTASNVFVPPGSSLTWERLGGPLGGLGYDVRMRPDNPDLMYVTDAWAGVFISEDGGANWSPSSEGIGARTGPTGDAIPIFCLTIDPNDHNIVWAGTQNTRGIFKSVDGGRSWQKMDNGVIESDGITFRGIAVELGDSNVVYAAAELSSWVWNNGQGRNGREFDMVGGVVYKSTDGGLNWRQVWRGDNLARYIWIDPRDANVIYVSTGIFDREAANSDPQAGIPGGEGVLKSTDGGQTWMNINNGLNNLYVGTLFMHPQNPDILLAGTGNNQYFDHAGVYLSEDGGASWKQALRDDIIEAVEFASSDPSIAYAGSSSSIYRSEDGGRTWKRVSGGGEDGWGAPGVRAGFPIDFQVDPRDPNRIFANEYGGGNFLSEDGGRTWVDASRGYTGAQGRAIAVDPSEPGRVIVAARSGIFVSSDGGINWEGLNYPPVVSMEWNAVAIDPSNPLHVVAATNWGNFLLNSTDGGRTWQRVMNFGEQRVSWRVVMFAPSDSRIVYAGSAGYFSAGSFDPEQPGKGVYVSRDGGVSWQSANDGLTQEAHVTSLAVDPTSPQIVYAATTKQGLLKTMDGGVTWRTVEGKWGGAALTSVAVNPADPNQVFVGLQRGALYKSADGGQSWARSASGLNPEASVSSIIFDPVHPLEIAYLADTASGVYRSTDGGQTWQAINNGLTTRAINALAISSDGLHLYAASEGGGAFRLDLNGQPPESAAIPTVIPTILAPTGLPPQSSVSPTPQPSGSGGPCGGAAIIPLGILLLAQWRRKARK